MKKSPFRLTPYQVQFLLVVGFVTVDPRTFDLDQLVVAPEAWGQGVAASLLAVISGCRALRCPASRVSHVLPSGTSSAVWAARTFFTRRTLSRMNRAANRTIP